MPALPVVCTFCNEAIYDYTGPAGKVTFDADLFEPRRGLPRPERFECPLCGAAWVAVSLQKDAIRMIVSPSTRGSGTVKF